jgi:hypothetical protein
MNFQETKREIVAKGKWITLQQIHYVDPKNTARVYYLNIPSYFYDYTLLASLS